LHGRSARSGSDSWTRRWRCPGKPSRPRWRSPIPVPAPLEFLLLNWQDVNGVDAGSIGDVADFYRQQPSGQLVILGPPGAGKTVLLSRLVVDLIDHLVIPADGELPTDVKVPVLLSLPSCDLGDIANVTGAQLASRLTTWITNELIEDYQVRADQAAGLVDGRRVLPVLDGLDEMDDAGSTRIPPRGSPAREPLP